MNKEKYKTIRELKGELLQIAFSKDFDYIGIFYCDRMSVHQSIETGIYYIHFYNQGKSTFCFRASDYTLNADETGIEDCYRLDFRE